MKPRRQAQAVPAKRQNAKCMGTLCNRRLWWCLLLILPYALSAQKNPATATSSSRGIIPNPALFQGLQWRCIGPFRGGRSVAVCGVPQQPQIYYMGSTGGGLWKTEDAGITWFNISDPFFQSGSVGAIAIADSDPNIIYVGMGEHAVRGVMTSQGDGLYASTDAGQTWKHIGLPMSKHIAAIRIHPADPQTVYVAVQGALYSPSQERGVYKTTDGGLTWRRLLYVNEFTGACDLSMDARNPRILYAGMWDHQRTPWSIRSGGPGSGLYKTTDGGETWFKLSDGLPQEMGKVAIDVSKADSKVVYANIEADNGGVFRSDDGGRTWRLTCSQRQTIARAWYFTEICADPQDASTVYVLNDPLLKSIDGGKTFEEVATPHPDQHSLWINPANPVNVIVGNDGGASVSFNGGKSWSSQYNQPTGQFYRVVTDNAFPYQVYGGQQDYSAIAIASRTQGAGIDGSDWHSVAGCESGFVALNPKNPELIFGGCYQGGISVYNTQTKHERDIMAVPVVGLGMDAHKLPLRFNWNAPIVVSPQQPDVVYHAANVVLRTTDAGMHWDVISPDLTRNEASKQGPGGAPFTKEGAGGEIYNTISYLACSPRQGGELWAGADDGLLHLSRNDGKTWSNITPPELGEALINCIEVSPHADGTAYVVATRYKWNDTQPLVFLTEDYGKSWQRITDGIGYDDYVRVVREDPKQKGLLYAGTESGLYISFTGGKYWHRFQLNLPACPVTDLTIRDNDLVASTAGRAFWILDDIGPIRQCMGRRMNGEAILFQPKPTYRFDANTPNYKIEGLGQNPATGVIVSYYLPTNMDTTTLYLQILDEEGHLVRQYASQSPKTPLEAGLPAPRTFPVRKGVNRFNWDLRRPQLPVIPDVVSPYGYYGSMVGPGQYTVRLITPADTLQQNCLLLADPRVEISFAAYAEHQQTLRQIESLIREVGESVLVVRDIRQQVAQLAFAANKVEDYADIISMSKRIVEKIDAWELQLIQIGLKTPQDAIGLEPRLYEELAALLRKADAAEPVVTQGLSDRLYQLSEQWSNYRQEMQDMLDNDLASFNALFKAKNVPAVILPKSVTYR